MADTPPTTEQIIDAAVQSAARLIIDSIVSVLQNDPHSWSTRECETCRVITGLIRRPFGCYEYARQRAKNPRTP